MKAKIVVILIVFLIFSMHQVGYAWGRRWRPVPPPPPPVAPPVASGSSGKASLPGSAVVVIVASGVLLLGLWRRKRNEDSD